MKTALENDRLKLLAYRICDPVRAKSKPEATIEAPSDVTPRIARRAYELYEQRGRRGDPAVQDWEQAEREIRKDEPRK